MLPQSLLDGATKENTTVGGTELVPCYLGPHDTPWVRALLDEHERFIGLRRSDFVARLKEPLRVRAPRAKLRLAAHSLDRMTRTQSPSAVPPREARRALFAARASAPNAPRATVLESAAHELRVTTTELEASLFADLEREKRLAPLPEPLSAAAFADQVNLDLVQGLVARAVRVELHARGETRALVRHAQLRGLLCSVLAPPDADARSVTLEVSGPYALFRHTQIYGRALASLVPRAAWCDEFELRADCVLGAPTRSRERAWVVIRSGDPIAPARELPRYDSQLEQRFAKDFARHATDWDITREPRPFTAGQHLIFPDFELTHRQDPTRRFLVEIVGFWTRDYLEQKLRRLAEAKIENLILCIDQSRQCSEQALPEGARIVSYRRKIDPAKVLELICQSAGRA